MLDPKYCWVILQTLGRSKKVHSCWSQLDPTFVQARQPYVILVEVQA